MAGLRNFALQFAGSFPETHGLASKLLKKTQERVLATIFSRNAIH